MKYLTNSLRSTGLVSEFDLQQLKKEAIEFTNLIKQLKADGQHSSSDLIRSSVKRLYEIRAIAELHIKSLKRAHLRIVSNETDENEK
jgi:hypothetical protein